MEPSLNRFNFSGICKRYLDSNGYSLRSGGQDLGTRFRFRLNQSGASLRLEALDPQQRAPIMVGQAAVPAHRDPNGFVALQLEPGWALERRVYQGRQLNHLYFAHQDPVNRLLALASSRGQREQPAGSADAADRTTSLARCASNAPTNTTHRQQCSDPAAGDSLPPLRANRHSAS